MIIERFPCVLFEIIGCFLFLLDKFLSHVSRFEKNSHFYRLHFVRCHLNVLAGGYIDWRWIQMCRGPICELLR
jgi:drug/metabolite transporter superfamily protein YnfA